MTLSLLASTSTLVDPKTGKINDIGYNMTNKPSKTFIPKVWQDIQPSIVEVEKMIQMSARELTQKENCVGDILNHEYCPTDNVQCPGSIEYKKGTATLVKKTIFKAKEKREVPYNTGTLIADQFIPPNCGSIDGAQFSAQYNTYSSSLNGQDLYNKGYKLPDGRFAVKMFSFGSGCGGFTLYPVPDEIQVLQQNGSSVARVGSSSCCSNTISSGNGASASILAIWNSIPSGMSYVCDDYCLIGKPASDTFGFYTYSCPADFQDMGNGQCKKEYSYYQYSCQEEYNDYNQTWKGPLVDTGGDCQGNCSGYGCICNSATPPDKNCARDFWTCPVDANQTCTMTPELSDQNSSGGYIYSNGSSETINTSIIHNKICPTTDSFYDLSTDKCYSETIKGCQGNSENNSTYTLNTTNNMCERKADCTTFGFDGTNYGCTYDPAITAETGFTFNSSLFKMQKSAECPTGMTFNSSKGLCVSSPSCPVGTSFNQVTSKCEGAYSCSKGTFNNSTKMCESGGITTYNASGGGCQCFITNFSLSVGEFDFLVQQDGCTFPRGDIYSPNSYNIWWDVNCGSGNDGYFNIYNDCSNSQPDRITCNKLGYTCNAGDTLNGTTCSHNTLIQVAPTCPTGTTFDSTKNICVATATCANGKGTLTNGECLAAKTECSNSTYDAGTDSCLKNPITVCKNSDVMLGQKCFSKITNSLCAGYPALFNGTTCTISPVDTCQPGSTFDSAKNKCVSSSVCEEGFIPNPDGSKTCIFNYSYNIYKCPVGYEDPIERGNNCEGTCGAFGCECNSNIPPANNCRKPLISSENYIDNIEKRPLEKHKITKYSGDLSGEYGQNKAYDCGESCQFGIANIKGEKNSICIEKITGQTACYAVEGCSFSGAITNLVNQQECYQCDPGYALNGITLKCEKNINCELGTDANNCYTELEASCDPDFKYNKYTGKCEKLPACGQGTFNQITNKCEGGVADPACNNGLTYDPNSFLCRYNNINSTCPLNQSYNVSKEQCEGAKYCEHGVFNVGTNRCEYSASCPVGNYDYATGRCIYDYAATGYSYLATSRYGGPNTLAAGWCGGSYAAPVGSSAAGCGTVTSSYGAHDTSYVCTTLCGCAYGNRTVVYVADAFTCPNGGTLSGNRCITSTDPVCPSYSTGRSAFTCYEPKGCGGTPFDSIDQVCFSNSNCTGSTITIGNKNICAQTPNCLANAVFNFDSGKCESNPVCDNGSTFDTVTRKCKKDPLSLNCANGSTVINGQCSTPLNASMCNDINATLINGKCVKNSKTSTCELSESNTAPGKGIANLTLLMADVDPHNLIGYSQNKKLTGNINSTCLFNGIIGSKNRKGPMTSIIENNDQLKFWDSYLDGDLGRLEIVRNVYEKDKLEGYEPEIVKPYQLLNKGFSNKRLDNATYFISIDNNVNYSTCDTIASQYGLDKISSSSGINISNPKFLLNAGVDFNNDCVLASYKDESFENQEWAVKITRTYTNKLPIFKCSKWTCQEHYCQQANCREGFSGTIHNSIEKIEPDQCQDQICDKWKPFADYCGKEEGCDPLNKMIFENNNKCYQYICPAEGTFDLNTKKCSVLSCPQGTIEQNGLCIKQ